eukprot:gnl/TRDRNA2_/TRDRNA2_100839_c0_seq1.p2 gnl/TRDRNA2_/TRDRNA2_100839_c0~~gnl/TRDRNA2_/TRDRNA2_100839_c0_seq1.p2  ORF type:complete len:120 (-),score=9.94 gnl/TRDRNA2_/TRDRNA2_100839_c0_seq1:378-737(-)
MSLICDACTHKIAVALEIKLVRHAGAQHFAKQVGTETGSQSSKREDTVDDPSGPILMLIPSAPVQAALVLMHLQRNQRGELTLNVPVQVLMHLQRNQRGELTLNVPVQAAEVQARLVAW